MGIADAPRLQPEENIRIQGQVRPGHVHVHVHDRAVLAEDLRKDFVSRRCGHGETWLHGPGQRAQVLQDELFEVRKMGRLDALYEDIGMPCVGQYQRRPDLLLVVFIAEHAADADGRHLPPRRIARAGVAADLGIDDPVVDAIRRQPAQHLQEAAHLLLHSLEVGGHVVARGDQVGDGEVAVELVGEETVGLRRQGSGRMAPQVELSSS